MRKLTISVKILIAVIFFSGCVPPEVAPPVERKVKKVYRLVAVKKDSTRVIIGTFK